MQSPFLKDKSSLVSAVKSWSASHHSAERLLFYSSEQKKRINFRSVNGAHKLMDTGESSCTEHGCPDVLSYNSVTADVG